MLLVSTLHIANQQTQNTNMAFSSLWIRVLSFTLLQASFLSYQEPLGCKRLKVGSGADDKPLINLQEIK